MFNCNMYSSGLLMFINIYIVKGFLTRGAHIFAYDYVVEHMLSHTEMEVVGNVAPPVLATLAYPYPSLDRKSGCKRQHNTGTNSTPWLLPPDLCTPRAGPTSTTQ